ncbi:MAG: alpha/beta hydrolase domain-containing protein [Gammaproteobacteria bacterium]|nr:alpha/beta hydrolase domain-containing protein [Gammaproteobacteria bacterium]
MSKLALFFAVCVSCCFTNAATITGPITGGERGEPFSAVDVADLGYVSEEYFIEGEANAYDLVEGTHSPDGKWTSKRSDKTAGFKTRMLVVRPSEPENFNGTVIVFWLNVTAGLELGSAAGESLRGYTWVGVSAQKVGIDGFPQDPQGLKSWDPERYETLVHPGDVYSYSIFTQVAQALSPDRDKSNLDPMGGLAVERLIAVGASQSAMRLRTYINGVHHVEHVFDGYIPFIDFGRVFPFEQEMSGNSRGSIRASIRADLDVPTIVVNSETEVPSYYGVREEDSDRFRYWEVAGTSHVSVARPEEPGSGGNWLSYSPVYNAAIRHLHVWIKDGIAPPMMPRIEVNPDSQIPEVVRDAQGNALGGIRLPDLEVPSAAHSGFGIRQAGTRFGFLYGRADDFDDEQLSSLYPDSATYVTAWNEAMNRSIEQGMVLVEDATPLREQAARWATRLDGSEAQGTSEN